MSRTDYRRTPDETADESHGRNDTSLENWLITENERGERVLFVDASESRSDGTRVTTHHNLKMDPETGSMKYRELDGTQRSVVNSEVQRANVGSGSEDLSFEDTVSAEYRDIVERADQYVTYLNDCSAYDYTHQLGGVTVQYEDDIANFGSKAVALALLAIAGGAAVESRLVRVIGRESAGAIIELIKRFYDTDALSITASEYDVGAFGWTQTMYKVNLSPEWHEEDPNAGLPLSTAPTHPGR